MDYGRYISDIKKLKNINKALSEEDLGIKLSEDFVNQGNGECVFPAIRNDGIHFYYKGSRIFTYSNKFRTHFKFLQPDGCNDYVSLNDVHSINFEKMSFINLYDGIKRNGSKYAGVESQGISSLYSKNSYVGKHKGVVVLDVEFRFNKKDRVDLLLYNIDTKTLMFVEAKHFTNSELWSSKDGNRKVVNQLNKYTDDIGNGEEIIVNYNHYIKNIKDIFNIKLPPAEHCIPYCGLYVFGFDGDQKDGKLKDGLLMDGTLDNYKCYVLGNPKKIDIDNLWNKLT